MPFLNFKKAFLAAISFHAQNNLWQPSRIKNKLINVEMTSQSVTRIPLNNITMLTLPNESSVISSMIINQGNFDKEYIELIGDTKLIKNFFIKQHQETEFCFKDHSIHKNKLQALVFVKDLFQFIIYSNLSVTLNNITGAVWDFDGKISGIAGFTLDNCNAASKVIINNLSVRNLFLRGFYQNIKVQGVCKSLHLEEKGQNINLCSLEWFWCSRKDIVPLSIKPDIHFEGEETLVIDRLQNLLGENKCDAHGYSSLHYWAIIGDKDSIKSRLYEGLDPDLKNNYGHTPLDFARKYFNDDAFQPYIDLRKRAHKYRLIRRILQPLAIQLSTDMVSSIANYVYPMIDDEKQECAIFKFPLRWKDWMNQKRQVK